ncbi:cytochrome b/b6 domain-containing protein [Rhizobium sp. RM]|nr:cytochrome b/b6 domain-containing protein [Rhizobium sp. RM]NWJ27102.1 cytochrome b/b6 domain-containing protein [Rhizobium sp. RM]
MNMWLDSPGRYGLISRLLHWGMAYLLIWQFAVIVMWRVFGPADWVKSVTSFGPGHGAVGLLTIILVVIRVIWTRINRGRRPERASGWSGRAAAVVHFSFYGLICHSCAGASKGLRQRSWLYAVDTGNRCQDRLDGGACQPVAWGFVVVPVSLDCRAHRHGAVPSTGPEGWHACAHGGITAICSTL